VLDRLAQAYPLGRTDNRNAYHCNRPPWRSALRSNPVLTVSASLHFRSGSRKDVAENGQGFPKRAGKDTGGPGYSGAISAALRGELGDSHQAIKTVMRWSGASERTAKNWLAGTRGPTGEHLLSLIRHSNAVLEVAMRLSGRESSLATIDLVAARMKIVELLKGLDDLLVNGPVRRDPLP